MEAYAYLRKLFDWVLILNPPLTTLIVILLNSRAAVSDEDGQATIKKQIKTAIVASIVIECIFGFIYTIKAMV